MSVSGLCGPLDGALLSNLAVPLQRIQTVSAADPDEPIGGHRFSFSLAQEAAGKANFSVRDNKGGLNTQQHTTTHNNALE